MSRNWDAIRVKFSASLDRVSYVNSTELWLLQKLGQPFRPHEHAMNFSREENEKS